VELKIWHNKSNTFLTILNIIEMYFFNKTKKGVPKFGTPSIISGKSFVFHSSFE